MGAWYWRACPPVYRGKPVVAMRIAASLLCPWVRPGDLLKKLCCLLVVAESGPKPRFTISVNPPRELAQRSEKVMKFSRALLNSAMLASAIAGFAAAAEAGT